MKTIIYIICLIAIAHSGYSQPEWVFGKLPEAANDTYYYSVGMGSDRGKSHKEARIDAITSVYADAAMRLGMEFKLADIRQSILLGNKNPIKTQVYIVCEYFKEQNDMITVWVLCQVSKAGNVAAEFTTYDCTQAKILNSKEAKEERRKTNESDIFYMQLGLLLNRYQSDDFEHNNLDAYGISVTFGAYPDYGLGYSLSLSGSVDPGLSNYEFGASSSVGLGSNQFSTDIGIGLGYNFNYGMHTDLPISVRYRNLTIGYKICWYNTPKQPKNKFEKALSFNEIESYSEALECFENGGFRKNIGGVVEDRTLESGWRPSYLVNLSHVFSLSFTIKGW